ncbi:MAG: cytochrome c biogenesis heme-transporting ATPase CcmA [Gammaproteobacteria bacterium]|nr:cytochrome c biogenesis heme-transporting ATPase CcmA [Gammaproteobacteria bacterium]
MPTLSINNLAASRGDRTLFRSLDFSVESGQCLHITGHNGCGKTTLLRVLCGLTRPDTGTVSWQGDSIAENSDDYHASQAYVGHKNSMHGDLTALENLDFSTRVAGAEVGMSPVEALKLFGLQAYAHLPVRVLSQGQQRRAALARLLLNKKPLWIMDEPFSGLDTQNTAVLYQQIERHLDQGGMLVVTAHHGLELGKSRVSELNLEGYKNP